MPNQQKPTGSELAEITQDAFAVGGDDVFIPDCISSVNDKKELQALTQSARYNMRALQLSAARICSDVYRAEQLFGEKNRKQFISYALANFFSDGGDLAVVQIESRRRRINDWVQKGELLHRHLALSGKDNVDAFSHLTMAALASLVNAAPEVAQEVLSNPTGVRAIDIVELDALQKATTEKVASELANVKAKLEEVTQEANQRFSEYENVAAKNKARIDAMDQSQDIANRQLIDAGDQLLALQAEGRKLKDKLHRYESNGASPSRIKSATNAVTITDEARVQQELIVKGLQHQAEQLKTKIESMKGQVEIRTDVVSTLEQLRGDTTSMVAKYPAALRIKMQQVDPRVSAMLSEISANMRTLADQLDPHFGVTTSKFKPLGRAEISSTDVLEA